MMSCFIRIDYLIIKTQIIKNIIKKCLKIVNK